jgi:hypothetical protein
MKYFLRERQQEIVDRDTQGEGHMKSDTSTSQGKPIHQKLEEASRRASASSLHKDNGLPVPGFQTYSFYLS